MYQLWHENFEDFVPERCSGRWPLDNPGGKGKGKDFTADWILFPKIKQF